MLIYEISSTKENLVCLHNSFVIENQYSIYMISLFRHSMEQDTNKVINDTAAAFRKLNSLCTRAERVG